MAKIEQGILGPFLGKVGTVIGGVWRGIHYIRSRPPRRRNSNTPAQLDQQAKFSVVTQFARQLSGLFDITYKLYGDRMTPRNSAIGYIAKNAIMGEYPDYSIDYPKVLISRGGLEPAASTTTSVAAGQLTWTWVSNSGTNGAADSDQSIVVVYCPEKKQCLYKIYAGTRGEGTTTLDVQPFAGLSVVTYLGFISENGKKVSDSVFTGELVIS